MFSLKHVYLILEMICNSRNVISQNHWALKYVPTTPQLELSQIHSRKQVKTTKSRSKNITHPLILKAKNPLTRSTLDWKRPGDYPLTHPPRISSETFGRIRSVPQTPLAAPRHLIEENISLFIFILVFYLDCETVVGLVVHVGQDRLVRGWDGINIRCAPAPTIRSPPTLAHLLITESHLPTECRSV